MLERVKAFLEERAKWKAANKPIRSDDRIKELFEICKSNQCGQYISIKEGIGQCGLCGCNLKDKNQGLNKLTYATTTCPHEPPFWLPEPEFQDIKLTEQQIEEIKTEEPPPPPTRPRRSRGCNCGG